MRHIIRIGAISSRIGKDITIIISSRQRYVGTIRVIVRLRQKFNGLARAAATDHYVYDVFSLCVPKNKTGIFYFIF